MSSSKPIPFDRHQVAEYERRRYRGLDQRLVHWRETKILKKWLKELAQKGPGLCLDAPCGYGRFSHLILKVAISLSVETFLWPWWREPALRNIMDVFR